MLRSSLVVALAIATLTACSRENASDRTAALPGMGRPVALDTMQIPAELRALAPLAGEWGIGDDVKRGEKVARSTAAERAALRAAVLPHDQRISAWLDSFGAGATMSDEAAAFMYMRLAIEEMPAEG